MFQFLVINKIDAEGFVVVSIDVYNMQLTAK